MESEIRQFKKDKFLIVTENYNGYFYYDSQLDNFSWSQPKQPAWTKRIFFNTKRKNGLEKINRSLYIYEDGIIQMDVKIE